MWMLSMQMDIYLPPCWVAKIQGMCVGSSALWLTGFFFVSFHWSACLFFTNIKVVAEVNKNLTIKGYLIVASPDRHCVNDVLVGSVSFLCAPANQICSFVYGKLFWKPYESIVNFAVSYFPFFYRWKSNFCIDVIQFHNTFPIEF